MVRQSNTRDFLTVSEIDVVRRSFLNVSVENARAGEIFYQQLFDDKPELRALFVGDISAQSEKLTNMLGVIVSQLHNLPSLMPMLRDLARRHLAYGVKVEHYKDVGSALLHMIQDVLGSDFSPEMAMAWTKAYDGIALTMIQSSFGKSGVSRYRAVSNS